MLISFSQLRQWGAAVGIGLVGAYLYLKGLPVFSGNPYFLFALPLVMVVLLIMVLDIEKMLLLVIYGRLLMEPLGNASRVGGSGMGIGALMNLFVLIVGGILFLSRFPRVKNAVSLKAWFFFMFICFLGILYSPVPSDALRLALNYLSYMMMFVMPFLIIEDEKDVRKWIKTILFSSVLPVLFANFDLLQGGRVYADAGMRIKGLFTHPNILAFYLVMLLVLFFYNYQTKLFKVSPFQRNCILLYVLNIFILLLATKTRSAWLSLWAVFFVFGFLKSRKYLVWAVLLPLVVIPFSTSARERVMSLFDSSNERNSLSWRVELWNKAIPEIQKSPIWGYGTASFNPLSHQFFEGSLKRGMGAHNIYIQLAFELGLLGLFGFVAIFLGMFLALIKRRGPPLTQPVLRGRIILFTFILSYLVVGASDNMLHYLAFNWYFFFLLGVLLAQIKINPLPVGDDAKITVNAA